MIRQQELRLRRLFQGIVLTTLGASAPPVLLAAGCSSESRASGDAGADAACFELLDVGVYQTDAGTDCVAYQTWSCKTPTPLPSQDGACAFSLEDCIRLCPLTGVYHCNAGAASCVDGALVDAGTIHIECGFCSSTAGRRPAGLHEAELALGGTALGDHFAWMAHLEAAAVVAFRVLAEELVSFSAPAALVRAARRAACDEVRHARAMGRLARRFGGTPPAVQATPAPARSLETLARENAVEGAVRETYGALIACFQAERARDPEVRGVLRSIAEDETRHAALSHALARWAESSLDPPARARVAQAERSAVSELEARVSEPPRALAEAAGFPGAGEQRQLIAALKRELWA